MSVWAWKTALVAVRWVQTLVDATALCVEERLFVAEKGYKELR